MKRRTMLGLLAAGPAALALTNRTAAADPEDRNGESPQDNGLKGVKVLMPVGDGTEVVDTLYPFFRLAEEGVQVVVCGPEARMYHMVTHEIPPNSNVPWDITQEGGTYVNEPLVVDGNLISCRTWHDYDTQFMKTFIRHLSHVETARQTN